MSAVPRVIYIMGEGRSGSTLLGDLLGQVDGFFHAGEVDHIWGQVSAPSRSAVIPCSCGEAVPDCVVWSEVIARVRSSVGPSAPTIARWPRNVGRLRRLRSLLAGRRVLQREPAAAAYADMLSGVYAAIADVTSARVVIDSSKHPAEGLLACSHRDIEAFALHLVRDPRAVLHSRLRLGSWRPDAPAVRGRTSVFNVARWSVRNWLADSISRRCAASRSIRVRYEDLVTDPARTLVSILDALGVPNTAPPPIHGRTVEIVPGHVLAGNLTKFRTGPVEIREDPTWRAAQASGQRLLGTVLTFPLLRRYGYPVRPGRSTR